MRSLLTVKPDTINGFEYIDTEKYGSDDISEIICERNRFESVKKMSERIMAIPYDKFHDLFTPHFYISAENLNDAYLAMLEIYFTVTQMDEEVYGSLITGEPPSTPSPFSSGGFNDHFGGPDHSFYDNSFMSKEEKELLAQLREENTPMMHVNRYSFGVCNNFIELDPDGKKLLFYIKIRSGSSFGDDFEIESDAKRMKDEEAYAKSINFVYVYCGKDSDAEKSEMLKNALIDSGFDVSGVEKQLSELASNKDNITEYTVQVHMKSILNMHLLNDPDSAVLTAADFSSIDIRTAKKSAEKTTTRHKIVGLKREREKINGIVKMISLESKRREMGLSEISNGCNMVFAGSPGTAKTTLAREFAAELAKLGFIKSAANFKECTKSDIVGAYVGWTAMQVDDMFLSMSRNGGGVIFFDEIYTLSEKDSTCFDDEAVTCIVQNMENYRESVYCIFAGYEDKMDEFLSANPGIRSRISFTVKFDDYSNEILNDVFESIVIGNGYKLPRGFEEITDGFFDSLKRTRKAQFGNGREARNLFTNSVQKMAIRLGLTKKLTRHKLTQLTLSDISEAAKDILDSEIKISGNKTSKLGF